jgi:hypothetical protein
MIARRSIPVGLLLLLVGCATPLQVGPNPALFPRSAEAPTGQVAGRVALWVPPHVAATENQSDRLLGAGSLMHVPVGRIVEQAARLALGDALSGGVQRVDALPPAGAGYNSTLVLDSVRCVDRVRLLWLLPVPIFGIIGDTEIDVLVAFEMRLLDAQGRTVWTRTYDSGRVVWKRPAGSKESGEAGIVRLAHEAAWRLSQQVATDLRDWLVTERSKPREL